MQKTHQSAPRQMPPAPAARIPRWWRRRPPAGVDGAVFWLALGFGLLWLLRLAPSGGGLLLVWMQLLVGLALLSLAVPLAWRLVHKHLLWSLRNKLGNPVAAEDFWPQRVVEDLLGDLVQVKGSRRLFEAQALSSVAYAILQSALARTESRGAHFRNDFPKRDDVQFRKHSRFSREGQVVFEEW